MNLEDAVDKDRVSLAMRPSEESYEDSDQSLYDFREAVKNYRFDDKNQRLQVRRKKAINLNSLYDCVPNINKDDEIEERKELSWPKIER